MLNFKYWLALFKVLNLAVNKESCLLRMSQRTERRQVLKTQPNSPDAYLKICADHQKAIQMRIGKLNIYILKEAEMSNMQFQKSMEFFQQQKESPQGKEWDAQVMEMLKGIQERIAALSND